MIGNSAATGTLPELDVEPATTMRFPDELL